MNTPLRCLSVAFVGLLVALAACGTDRRPVGGGSIAEPDFADALAQALCAAVYRCCEPGDEVATALRRSYASEAECRTSSAAGARSELSRQTAAVAAGTVLYDASAAGRCVAAIESASCGPTLYGDAFQFSLDCYVAYTGTSDVGDACTDDVQCATPDGGRADCTDGICVLNFRYAALGEACGDPRTLCLDSYCGGGTCKQRVAAGSPCTDPASCTSQTCTDGVCVAQPLGSDCANGGQCESGWCAASVCIAPVCDGV